MNDFNISGVLVHVRLADLERVRTELGKLPGVELHGQSDDGRLIVTVEDTEARMCAETVTGIQYIDGVLSAALVYQHTDTSEPLEESAQ